MGALWESLVAAAMTRKRLDSFDREPDGKLDLAQCRSTVRSSAPKDGVIPKGAIVVLVLYFILQPRPHLVFSHLPSTLYTQ